MNNREWLYSLDVADLADWFDAEHAEQNERDELEAFAKRLERAAHDKLGVTLFGVDYVTEEFMLHVRDTLTAERDEWKAKAEQAERAMNAAAGKWARADDENRELRKMLLLDDGTVEEYTERADPLTALAYQKQLAEEWRDRCHNAEAWCDKLESERDELQRELDIANAKLAGKPECEICDRATLLVEIEKLRDERDVRADDACGNDGFMDLDSCAHGVRTFASETDSREKLEADVRKHYAYSTTTLLYPPSANKTTDMLRSLPIDTVVGWLDRQAAITANETSHDNPYVGLVRGKQWERTEISDYYCGRCGWKVTDHDSYCPECGGALHKASNKPNSQFDVLKTAENAENVTSKNEIHNFDDSREQLEADVREWIDIATYKAFTPERMLEVMFHWLDRQAAITRATESHGWRMAASGPIYEYRQERDRLQAKLDEMEAECDALARDLAECDENRIEFRDQRDHAEKALDAMERERDYWKLHADCWADKYKDMRTSRDCFRERAKRNEDKAENYQRQLSKAERYGTIWPRWKDGAPIELPCAFEYMGNTERLQGIRFYSNAYVFEFTGIDHAKESFGIEYGTRHSRPPLIASDGKPILKGETLYGLSDSKAWTVTGFDRTRPWSVWAENGGGCKCLKPEWLAHEKPADGARAEKIAALEAENAELREKLGEAIGHAHEIGKLVDLEARAG